VTCQSGHEIAPGASYCAHGHPIAMQAMQINNDMYGASPPNAYGGGAPAPAYAAPPQNAYGAAPAPAPAAFGAGPTEPAAPGIQQPSATALRGFLVSYQTTSNGEFWPLKGGRVSVGRANSGVDVDISLADATISSRHAALHIDSVAGTVIVEDTGSTNGTYVNEEPIGQGGRRALADGDKLRFGGFTTLVKIVGRL
jgi:hypothetical protein